VDGKNHLDIQQKGITPISTMLRAATGIVTTYTVDVVGVWVWLTILLHILQNSHSHSIFSPLSQGHQQSQAIFGQFQIMILVSALSVAKCP